MRLTRASKLLRLCIFSTLALLAVSGNLVGYSAANPYRLDGIVPPDPETHPPVITISSPVNNTAYNINRVPLTFNVTNPQSRTASYVTLAGVTYEDDWRKQTISVLQGSQQQPSFNLWLSNVPEGQHTIVIKARGMGQITNEKELSYKWFFISSSTAVCFTIDRTPPTVSFLPPENASSTSAVPLNLTINEAYTKITYSLNRQQNVTVSGNSTIPHLPAGQYNITFYVWDNAGNIGFSDNANFTVAETAQTAETADSSLLLTATVALLTVVIIGVVLLFERRQKCREGIKALYLEKK